MTISSFVFCTPPWSSKPNRIYLFPFFIITIIIVSYIIIIIIIIIY